MAMYGSPPIPTRNAIHRDPPPELAPGDRVRISHLLSTDPGLRPRAGALGTVQRVSGGRVVVDMDTPYDVLGMPHTTFYSFTGELERMEVVGRLGAETLYSDDNE